MNVRSRELIVWRIKRSAQELGWSGMAGLAAFIFAAGYYFLNYLPLANEATLQRQALNVASVLLEQSGHQEEIGTPVRQLDEFYSRLQQHGDVPEVVRALHRSARAVGLRFVRGDYRPQRDAAGNLLRYQITLPVRGSYPKVRRFLAQAMRDEPALALDGVAFQTDKSGGSLETRVQFTLFVQVNESRSTFERADESRATFDQANESGLTVNSADDSPLAPAEARG